MVYRCYVGIVPYYLRVPSSSGFLFIFSGTLWRKCALKYRSERDSGKYGISCFREYYGRDFRVSSGYGFLFTISSTLRRKCAL